MKTKHILLLFSLAACQFLPAQQVDLASLAQIGKEKPLVINGGLSAGNVFYSGNGQSGRQAYTYYLNGSVNFCLFGQINLPFSVNLTNQGKDMSYPSLPNRLSLHPTYKWITAHIGDVSMTFSPYTLNGHQFTGAGVELTPGSKWKIAAMGGRLLKEVTYDPTLPSLMPNYKRTGMGAQVRYETTAFAIGVTYFAAKDKDNVAMRRVMDSLHIAPMSNQSLGFTGTLGIIKNLSLTTEYAVSLLKQDARSNVTSVYHALNARLNYQLKKNTIGIGYERIDPGYRTLGAYYFNNDYENLTLNYARPFLKGDKANVSLSFGVQRDNLDDSKEESSRRYVGSASISYNPTEKLQTSFNYSTFQSYRNLKSQFDYINETSPYENMDTLRFSQLSQNMDVSINYVLKKTKKQQQQANLLVSYQETADRHGGISLPGDVSRFLNSALGYSLQLIPQNINFTSSVNASYSYGGTIESYTVGPMAGITAAFFKKKLTTGLSAAYNVSINESDVGARVFNLRINAAYQPWKHHSFKANMVWQNRDITTKNKTDAVTATVAYAYNF